MLLDTQRHNLQVVDNQNGYGLDNLPKLDI